MNSVSFESESYALIIADGVGLRLARSRTELRTVESRLAIRVTILTLGTFPENLDAPTSKLVWL